MISLGKKEIYEIGLQNQAGHKETIGVTHQHPWLSASGEWKATKQLKTGDLIKMGAGLDLKVVSLVKTLRTEEVYTFTVADLHTYMVGKNQAVVHNSCTKTLAAFERQLAKDGMKSLEKSRVSIARQLAEHEAKLPNMLYKSSVEREIRVFKKQLEAIDKLY